MARLPSHAIARQANAECERDRESPVRQGGFQSDGSVPGADAARRLFGKLRGERLDNRDPSRIKRLFAMTDRVGDRHVQALGYAPEVPGIRLMQGKLGRGSGSEVLG